MTSTPLAAIILAHNDPVHVRRLITALDDIPIFLHCDARTDPTTAQAMLGNLPRHVRVVSRRRTSLASWSLVLAELDALRMALTTTRAEHIIVTSGADYPLVPMEQVARLLRDWTGQSHFWNTPIPYRRWDTVRHQDGGRWRLQHRFLTRHDQLIYLRDIPVRLPWKRQIPPGLELRAASQWKIYCHDDVRRLLHVVDSQAELLRFWRSTLIPEESFAASVLASRSLVGSEVLRPCQANGWLIRWPENNTDHPAWLATEDFDRLVSAAHNEPIGPDTAFVDHRNDPPIPHQKWFARKFSTARSGTLLNRVDRELLQ
ncbi:MAG TPA: beta-1,6-N-acetylglucosaminyltransferase [Microlunatus sp.]